MSDKDKELIEKYGLKEKYVIDIYGIDKQIGWEKKITADGGFVHGYMSFTTFGEFLGSWYLHLIQIFQDRSENLICKIISYKPDEFEKCVDVFSKYMEP